ncbi:adapter protein MecA 1/2 [Bacillus mesophilus]|uniref:Adapter protein MecA n=1 Tax=Bacillus mesophilus TaxID=1808955 RepID=A0A6M0Q389_9BACI|nr:adaptor protein MecA [Bacillus mesophilus]MBM7659751.1 adapter protein MecA 1/2 [Bacillus mesophilus]NEY70613.1 adaptor protein MecA [Bacillus mesophilus]
MEIERINEHTVKFYITYGDIEERGFDREEIWYNRERSEELFWEMMDEVHHQEEFSVEGPLWIQVQALEKGIEVIVTKAQISKDGQNFELSVAEDKDLDLPVDDKIESLLDQHFQTKNKAKIDTEEIIDTDSLQFLVRFRDFEDVISLSHRVKLEDVQNSLFVYENSYYLYVEFNEEMQEENLDNILSLVLEYGHESQLTIHRIEEYGKKIIEENALVIVNQHFALKP